jgi:hypothetical protein
MLYSVGNKQPAARRYSLKWMFQTVAALSDRKARRLQHPCTFHTFHFSTSNHTIANWVLTTAVPAFPPLRPFLLAISYAGYTDTHSYEVGASHKIVNLHVRDPRTGKRRDNSSKGVLEQRDSWQNDGEIPVHRTLSPYSHAVTAVEGSTYIISYYV